jgi:hypothetical protein
VEEEEEKSNLVDNTSQKLSKNDQTKTASLLGTV